MKVSPRQLELLVEFMSNHNSLALGRIRGREGSAQSQRLWAECTCILNSELPGAQKTPAEWKKYYATYKSRVKSEIREGKRDHHGTGGGPSSGVALTPLEERLHAIVGSGPPPTTVRHNPLEQILIQNDDGPAQDVAGAIIKDQHTIEDLYKQNVTQINLMECYRNVETTLTEQSNNNTNKGTVEEQVDQTNFNDAEVAGESYGQNQNFPQRERRRRHRRRRSPSPALPNPEPDVKGDVKKWAELAQMRKQKPVASNPNDNFFQLYYHIVPALSFDMTQRKINNSNFVGQSWSKESEVFSWAMG